MASTRFYVCSGLFCFGFWMLFGFLIGCTSVVHILNNALEVNDSIVQIQTDRVYTPGRYMLGVKKYFIEFPTIQQIIIFSDSLRAEKSSRDGAKFEEEASFYPTINSRSQEGLPVAFDVVIYFKLGLPTSDPSNPPPLAQQYLNFYNRFGSNWTDIVQRVTTFEMRNVAAEIGVLDYFQKRKEFGDDLREALTESLKEYYIELKDVSIVNIKISATLEDAITETEIIRQQVLTLNYTKQGRQIDANTSILVAERDANITLETAIADGNITFITKSAIANATITLLAKQKDAFQQVATNLGFNDDNTKATNLLTFFWIYIQRFNNVTRNNLGVPLPTALENM